MTHYGLIQQNPTLIILNAIQVVLNSYYILSYAVIVRNKVGVTSISDFICIQFTEYVISCTKPFDDGL